MSDEEIDKIIDELSKIKIYETQLISRLTQLRTREKAARTRPKQETNKKEDTGRDKPLETGDRIRITNTVRVKGRAVNDGDRTATVESLFTRDGDPCVWFVTDNGLKAWRKTKNVRKTTNTKPWL